MIEILHRAKRGDEWRYGCFCLYRDIPNLLVYGFEWVLVDKETVGRYTGLTDKNGTRIFEGDILVESKKRGGFDEWCYRYEVVYTSDDVGSCGCCVPAFSGIGFVFQGITGRFRGNFDELEIIGNIHDNPELLEVTE